MVNAERRAGSSKEAALALGKGQRNVTSLILKVYSIGDFCQGFFFFWRHHLSVIKLVFQNLCTEGQSLAVLWGLDTEEESH